MNPVLTRNAAVGAPSLFAAAGSSPSLRRLPMVSPGRWQTIESVVRYGGWLFFFLLLAPFLGPREYGLFLLSFSGVKIVETLFATVAAHPLTQSRGLGDARVATAFVTITATSGAVS